MRLILSVAEKNDAAKNIASLLSQGRSQRFDTFSPYNKIYKFRAPVQGAEAEMTMTSVSGHLLVNDFRPEMKNWNAVPFDSLFYAPLQTTCPENNQPIQRTLQAEARKATDLILWTDCDREGEAIAFEILGVCLQVNRRLNVFRATFSEITGAAVWRALNNLGAPDARLNDAVLTRSELDLRTGAAFTRLQTINLRGIVPQQQEQKNVISYGSCQFPTLGFVVERYKSRADFVEEAFWKLRLSHRQGQTTSEFSWARTRLFLREAVEALLELCQLAQTATVLVVRQKPKSRWRPLPLDTVELEKLGIRKLRLSAKQTLDTAEKLYQKGFISYPRTETNQFPKELDLTALVNTQAADPAYGAFANNVLQRGVNPRSGNKSDQAHPPIHPLKTGDNLNDLEQRVFNLIARHFLACVSRDATGSETIVEVEMGGEGFTATGLVILDRGYLDIYPFDQWNAKTVGHYAVGEVFRPDRIEMIDGHTSAPPLLTEADLITLMDKHGIGTDATHAQHIETIQTRGYVGLTPEARFIPGFLGLGLVEGYEALGYALARPNLRSDFESDLKAICEGRKNKADVLRAYIRQYRDVFTAVEAQFFAIAATLRRHFARAPPPQIQTPPPSPPPPQRGAPRGRGGPRGARAARRGGRGGRP